MSGRAGRRGKDDRGIVIQILDEQMEPDVAKNMIYGASDPLFRYATYGNEWCHPVNGAYYNMIMIDLFRPSLSSSNNRIFFHLLDYPQGNSITIRH
jgi:hypothetical protein